MAIAEVEYYTNTIKKSYSHHFFIGLGSQSDVDYSFNYSTEAKKLKNTISHSAEDNTAMH